MANYEVIKRLENYQYIDGCPVFITGGNLLKETESNDMFVNIRLRSLSEIKINAVILDVECFDVEEELLEGITRYQLLDLNINGGETFGDKSLIRCPDQYTRKCNVIIKKVIFSDETKWEFSDNDKVISLGLQTRLSNSSLRPLMSTLLDEFKAINYPRDNVVYIPNQCGGHWICTCGSINQNDNNCICGLEQDRVFEVFNEEYLKEREREYKEKQKRDEEERKRQQVLADQRREKERQYQHEVELKQQKLIEEELRKKEREEKKQLITVLSVVAVVIAFIVFCMLTGYTGHNLL